jgi:hypothetical protein
MRIPYLKILRNGRRDLAFIKSINEDILIEYLKIRRHHGDHLKRVCRP